MNQCKAVGSGAGETLAHESMRVLECHGKFWNAAHAIHNQPRIIISLNPEDLDI